MRSCIACGDPRVALKSRRTTELLNNSYTRHITSPEMKEEIDLRFNDPAVIVFIGVLFSIIGVFLGGLGAFRSARQQAHEQLELRKKSDEIAQLYQQIAASQTDLREKADIQAEAQRQLRIKSDEISALNREIAAAQIDLRKKSDEVAELNKTIAASITGGDSFCYVLFTMTGSTGARVTIFHQGTFPLYDVNIRIVDLEIFQNLLNAGQQLTPETYMKADTVLNVGNLSPGLATTLMSQPIINLGDRLQAKYNIFITARNGSFTELLRMRKINGRWQEAMKIERKNFSGENPRALPTLLKEKIDPDYPRGANGQIEWE